MRIVTSKINLKKAKIRQLEKATITSLEKTADALHTDVIQAQVMPFDTGSMQNDNTYVDYNDAKQGKISLITNTPYARRMYYHPEYNFQRTQNANAQGRWLDAWKSGKKKKFCKEKFIEFYKKEAGL